MNQENLNSTAVRGYPAYLVWLVVSYMPLHPNSLSAATFTEAADEQCKYWQAQEMLFQKQSEWENETRRARRTARRHQRAF